MPSLTYAFKTDKGRVRELNQDSLAVLAPEQLAGFADGLFVVADGIGSGIGGEIASRIAVDAVSDTVCSRALAGAAAPVSGEALREAACSGLHAANAAVWKRAHDDHKLHGMGTTCVLALIKGDKLIVGNVGDSRCYLRRAARLLQLTHDHAFLHASRGSRRREDAGPMQFRQVMTRAIGFAGMVEPEVESFTLKEGDALLLCSDGLSNLLEEAEIAEILTSKDAPEQMCGRLVALANANGGDDNITVIVLHYGAARADTTPAPPAPDMSGTAQASALPPSGAPQSAGEGYAPAAAPPKSPLPWWKRLARLRPR